MKNTHPKDAFRLLLAVGNNETMLYSFINCKLPSTNISLDHSQAFPNSWQKYHPVYETEISE